MSFIEKIECKFDENNNLIEEVFKGEFTINKKSIYKYDELNNCTFELHEQKNGSKIRILSQYNEELLIEQKKFYNLNPDPIELLTYTSSKEGYSTFLNGNIEKKEIIDENENIIKEINYSRGEQDKIIQFIYKKDLIIEANIYQAHNRDTFLSSIIKYEYDENENLIRELYFTSASTLIQEKTMEYDNNNNLVYSKENRGENNIKEVFYTNIYEHEIKKEIDDYLDSYESNNEMELPLNIDMD